MRAVAASSRAEPLRASGVRREVGIDPALEVHVLPAWEPLRNQYHLGQLAAEVPGDPQRQPGAARLLAQRLCRQLKQLAHATCQPAEVFIVRSGRHGGRWGAHTVNNTRGALAVPRRQAPKFIRHNDSPPGRAGPLSHNRHRPRPSTTDPATASPRWRSPAPAAASAIRDSRATQWPNLLRPKANGPETLRLAHLVRDRTTSVAIRLPIS